MKRTAALIVLSLALSVAPAAGQGCAMCSTGLKAAGERAQKAMARGVGLLMGTTLTLVGGLAFVAYRLRKPRDGDSEPQ